MSTTDRPASTRGPKFVSGSGRLETAGGRRTRSGRSRGEPFGAGPLCQGSCRLVLARAERRGHLLCLRLQGLGQPVHRAHVPREGPLGAPALGCPTGLHPPRVIPPAPAGPRGAGAARGAGAGGRAGAVAGSGAHGLGRVVSAPCDLAQGAPARELGRDGGGPRPGALKESVTLLHPVGRAAPRHLRVLNHRKRPANAAAHSAAMRSGFTELPGSGSSSLRMTTSLPCS